MFKKHENLYFRKYLRSCVGSNRDTTQPNKENRESHTCSAHVENVGHARHIEVRPPLSIHTQEKTCIYIYIYLCALK